VKTIFSTDEVHPRDRFDYWHSVACRTLVAHDSTPACRQTFSAQLRRGALAEIGLFELQAGGHYFSRSGRHADSEDFLICRQISGEMTLEQCGREIALTPGCFMLIDPRVPYSGSSSPSASSLVLKVPRHLLESRLGRAPQVMSVSVAPVQGEAALTSSLLAMLPAVVEGLATGTAEEMVREQVLDFVALSVGNAMGKESARVSSARAVVLMKVRSAIEARLADPGLDARSVALAAGVSLRYANAALADEGTSLGRLIQTRRLLRCRRALEDPSQLHRTVSEIAYGWGFSDMTHFGRRFKAAFGQLPSEYRKACQEPGSAIAFRKVHGEAGR
jgi:AraC family transcriptional regulator, positive regulator of tynA and feaB